MKEKNFINTPTGRYLTAFVVTLLTYWVLVYVGCFFVFVALSLLFFPALCVSRSFSERILRDNAKELLS